MFRGGDYRPFVPAQIVGWPDEISICFVRTGLACVVRTADPIATDEIDAFPITSVFVALEARLVVFADYVGRMAAYGRDRLEWRSDVANHDLRILGGEGEVITARGWVAGSYETFAVDVRTGARA